VLVMARKERLFVLSKHTELLAGEIRDDWLAVTVMEGEKQIRGWVKWGSVRPVR
jgi:hypothetical protein